MFTPNSTSLAVGQELRCSARGNPSPDIKLSPAALVADQSKSGSGWRSLVIEDGWVGRTLTVKCTASNSVDGTDYSPSHSVTFNVTGEMIASLHLSTSHYLWDGCKLLRWVCLSVCLFVWLKNYAAELNSPNFLCTLPVAVARSSSGGITIRYVLPVLWMTSCFTQLLFDASSVFLSGDRTRQQVYRYGPLWAYPRVGYGYGYG